MHNTENHLGKHYVRRYEKLLADNDNWNSLWQEVANYTTPNNDNVFSKSVPGERKFQRLYDSTSIQANKLLGSALHGMLTSPSSIWHGLASGIREVDDDHKNKLWLQDSVARMTNVLNQSNFQTQIHTLYLALGGAGTSVMFMGEHETKTIYFRTRPIYKYVVAENRFGEIDTVGECVEMSYKDLVDEYGEEVLPEEIKHKGMHNPETSLFKVVIMVEPNKTYNEMAPEVSTNKLFRSVHVLQTTFTVLRESGYDEQPYAVPRWTVFDGEKFGRSPGMESLPDTKMVNAMMKVNIRGAQKVVDPPLIVPDHGFALPLDTRPGGTIYKRQGIQDKIEPLMTGARPDIGEPMMESARLRIKQSFFIDQLQLVQQNNMTATEVMQRTEENLRLMGPILSRLNDELLRPIIDRLFGIMLRKNMFMPMPDGLKQVKALQVEYVSQIAKAQRASEASTLGRVVQAMMPIIEAQPQVMDNFDGDAALKYNARIFGLPEELLLDPAEVNKQRQQRQQAQQDQQEAMLQNQEADTMQKQSQAQAQQQQ